MNEMEQKDYSREIFEATIDDKHKKNHPLCSNGILINQIFEKLIDDNLTSTVNSYSHEFSQKTRHLLKTLNL
jgi:hypothetical protein